MRFFALCVAYLRWCDRIIGPDELGAERDDAASPYVVTAPTSVDTSATAGGDGMIAAASIDNWIALGIAVAGVLYLFAVLVYPERF